MAKKKEQKFLPPTVYVRRNYAGKSDEYLGCDDNLTDVLDRDEDEVQVVGIYKLTEYVKVVRKIELVRS